MHIWNAVSLSCEYYICFNLQCGAVYLYSHAISVTADKNMLILVSSVYNKDVQQLQMQ